MIIVFTVMSVLVAAAMPIWSRVIQREKEEELIFRGLQYAEAIRIFQLRHGRYPLRLEELITVRPRSIRQLWTDPMTDSGEWGLIHVQQVDRRRRGARGRRGRGAAQQQSQPQAFGGSGPRPLGGEAARRGTGRRAAAAMVPIIGVHSLSDEPAVKRFAGRANYSSWQFTAALLPVAMVAPDSLSPVRANARWVGRPFPPNVAPQGGGLPSAQGKGPADRGSRRERRRPGEK